MRKIVNTQARGARKIRRRAVLDSKIAHHSFLPEFFSSLLGDSNPCFRRERASFSHLIVLAALGNKKLGPDWSEKRGRGKSEYVMARKGDIGPYSPENVECLTNTQNHQARHPNGSVARGEIKSTLTEKQAKEIYLATDKLKNLAQRYSVGITTIESIKRGRTWKHVTSSLGQAHKNKVGRPRKDKISRRRKKRKIGIPFYTTESEKEALC